MSILDRYTIVDFLQYVRLTSFVLLLGTFIRVFIFGDASYLGAMLLSIVFISFIPSKQLKSRRKYNSTKEERYA